MAFALRTYDDLRKLVHSRETMVELKNLNQDIASGSHDLDGASGLDLAKRRQLLSERIVCDISCEPAVARHHDPRVDTVDALYPACHVYGVEDDVLDDMMHDIELDMNPVDHARYLTMCVSSDVLHMGPTEVSVALSDYRENSQHFDSTPDAGQDMHFAAGQLGLQLSRVQPNAYPFDAGYVTHDMTFGMVCRHTGVVPELLGSDGNPFSCMSDPIDSYRFENLFDGNGFTGRDIKPYDRSQDGALFGCHIYEPDVSLEIDGDAAFGQDGFDADHELEAGMSF